MDRSALKSRAREVISTSNPRVISVGLVYLLITVVLGALASRVMSVNISENEAMNYLRYAADGNYEYALKYAESMQPPTAAYAINMLLSLVSGVVGAGFMLFLLNTVRNREPSFGNLLDGFGFWWKVILLNLLKGLLIGLWKSPVQCLRESKTMMAGHKEELFRLDLSLIGWYLLGMAPYLGYAAQVWTVPYISMIKTLYYEKLLGSNVWSYTPDYPI